VNADLGFSQTDKLENIRRASEIAKLLASKGFWVICSFITPTIELRELVSIINLERDLVLVYIHAYFESCQRRDVKGQYLRANKGLIANFTGVSSTFEEPVGEGNCIDTDKLSVEEARKKCMEFILS
jgi:adenylylsulfate kinase